MWPTSAADLTVRYFRVTGFSCTGKWRQTPPVYRFFLAISLYHTDLGASARQRGSVEGVSHRGFIERGLKEGLSQRVPYIRSIWEGGVQGCQAFRGVTRIASLPRPDKRAGPIRRQGGASGFHSANSNTLLTHIHAYKSWNTNRAFDSHTPTTEWTSTHMPKRREVACRARLNTRRASASYLHTLSTGVRSSSARSATMNDEG